MRLFAAIVPPEGVLEDLGEFIGPRQEAGDPRLRWTMPFQWHLTLAFFGDLAERHLPELEERLGRAARRRTAMQLRIAGAGSFPNPAVARVLWGGVTTASEVDAEELRRLATGCRAAGAKAGAQVDPGRFTPHLTLARLARPANVTRWLNVLGSYAGPEWTADEVTLLASHLGQGVGRRPRYDVLGRYALG